MYREYGWVDMELLSTAFIYPQLKKVLHKTQNKKILDLGCGNGEIANKLIEEGFDVYGVDGSEQGVQIANKHNPEHFFVMNFEKDDLPEALKGIVFDTIISTEVIEHLYDPDAYIKLCKKVLRDSGKLIVTTPYHGYLKNLVLSVMGRWDAHFSPQWTGGHIKFWSLKTLATLLNQNGFEIRRFLGCGRIPWLWKSMLVEAECIKNINDI